MIFLGVPNPFSSAILISFMLHYAMQSRYINKSSECRSIVLLILLLFIRSVIIPVYLHVVFLLYIKYKTRRAQSSLNKFTDELFFLKVYCDGGLANRFCTSACVCTNIKIVCLTNLLQVAISVSHTHTHTANIKQATLMDEILWMTHFICPCKSRNF